MDHVAIEDLYGCIDREAMEIAERAVLPEEVFDAVAVQALVSAAADGYTVDTVVTCEPGNPWCRRNHLVADADGAVLHLTEPVAIGDCPSAHQLALEQVRRWWEDIFDSGIEPSPSLWVPALGVATGLGLWRTPSWRWSVEGRLDHDGRALDSAVGLRSTLGLPQGYDVVVSAICYPDVCRERRNVTLLALQAGGVVGGALGEGPLRLETGVWVGPSRLFGGGYHENHAAWSPWLDLEAALGLEFGSRGTWSLGFQGEPLVPTVDNDVGRDSEPFSWGRVALGVRFPLDPDDGRAPP